MKKVIIYYILALLTCFAFGLICALISFFSWWYILLLSFPISLGWIPFTMIIESTPNDKTATIGSLIVIAFIFLVLLLLLGTQFVNEDSFWGQIYIISIFAGIISHIVLITRIRNKVLYNI